MAFDRKATDEIIKTYSEASKLLHETTAKTEKEIQLKLQELSEKIELAEKADQKEFLTLIYSYLKKKARYYLYESYTAKNLSNKVAPNLSLFPSEVLVRLSDIFNKFQFRSLFLNYVNIFSIASIDGDKPYSREQMRKELRGDFRSLGLNDDQWRNKAKKLITKDKDYTTKLETTIQSYPIQLSSDDEKTQTDESILQKNQVSMLKNIRLLFIESHEFLYILRGEKEDFLMNARAEIPPHIIQFFNFEEFLYDCEKEIAFYEAQFDAVMKITSFSSLDPHSAKKVVQILIENTPNNPFYVLEVILRNHKQHAEMIVNELIAFFTNRASWNYAYQGSLYKHLIAIAKDLSPALKIKIGTAWIADFDSQPNYRDLNFCSVVMVYRDVISQEKIEKICQRIITEYKKSFDQIFFENTSILLPLFTDKQLKECLTEIDKPDQLKDPSVTQFKKNVEEMLKKKTSKALDEKSVAPSIAAPDLRLFGTTMLANGPTQQPQPLNPPKPSGGPAPLG